MKDDKTPWKLIAQICANALMVVAAFILLVGFLPLGLVCIAAIVLFNISFSKIKAEMKDKEAEADGLRSQVENLSKYQPIVDAQAEAERLTREAKTEAEQITSVAQSQADSIVSIAQTQANETASKAAEIAKAANQKLATAEENAARRLDDATVEAKRIIAAAEVKAEEIAGEAYQIKGQVDVLKATEQAIRNTIDGYGDEWLKPTYSLLDELADEFSHTDAGRRLKDARAFTAHMVATDLAADCDYVEASRKKTAIRFVIDAFNGKVDSTLSKTRDDNFGKLEQEIRDAYATVNFNGQAFRNARITPEYLDARLQELKWAVIVVELRKKEREEQRRIREQMREEARARREYERAQKAAAKEEAMLKKAMEKAKAMLEKANEEQRAKYEAQLATLEQQLKEAEEKGQRALSMAQQTKHGNVYVISNVGSFGENVYKVGMTRRLEPMDRVRELGDASVPFSFDVHAIIESDDAPALEHALHQELAMMQVNKVNPRKEFFRANLSDIRSLVEKRGLEAKWTMVAEAAEFRETQAIEERMKNDPDAQKQWAEFYERVGREMGEEDEDAEA